MVEALSHKRSSVEPQPSMREGKAVWHSGKLNPLFGEAGAKLGKSGNLASAGIRSQIPTNPQCPNCQNEGGKGVCRDGTRQAMFGPPIQRWRCKNDGCGLRFSDPVDTAEAKKTFELQMALEYKVLNSSVDISSSRQICACGKETKNLVAEQLLVVVPQNGETDSQNLENAIVNLLWKMKKDNKADITLQKYDYSLHQLLKIGVDLFRPETFIEKLALSEYSETRKYSLAKAYQCFLKHYGVTAKIPKYKPTRSLPYIPPEEYLDQLVGCCNQPMACLFQTLKETAARPVEAIRLEWDDLDIGNRKLSINHPAKGSNPRVLSISQKLLNMLLALPKGNKRIFPYRSAESAGRSFRKMRNQAIRKYGNLELKKIYFYTCRYWRATLEHHKTGDVTKVMQLLGHRSLKYVLLYDQLDKAYFGEKAKTYICRESFNRQEEKQLIEQGFEYIRTDKEGVSLYRKVE